MYIFIKPLSSLNSPKAVTSTLPKPSPTTHSLSTSAQSKSSLKLFLFPLQLPTQPITRRCELYSTNLSPICTLFLILLPLFYIKFSSSTGLLSNFSLSVFFSFLDNLSIKEIFLKHQSNNSPFNNLNL